MENEKTYANGIAEGHKLASEGASVTQALYAALAKAQADCAGTEKKSENKHHRYKYASAEDMIDASTQAMAPHGLSLILISSEPDEPKQPRSMTVRYLMTHAEGGSMALGPYSLTVHPDKGRPMDKAITTCLTYLQAYCIRGILNVPRVEEGTERDSTDDKMIQAYASQEQKDREKREKAAAAEHKEKREALKVEGDLIKEHAPPFFAAASLTMDKQTKGAFLLWAANAEAWPRDVNVQIEITAAAAAYLIEWGQMEDVDALQAANDFCRYLTGDVLGNDEVKF